MAHAQPAMMAGSMSGRVISSTALASDVSNYSGFQISIWQSNNRIRSPWLYLALAPPSPAGRGRTPSGPGSGLKHTSPCERRERGNSTLAGFVW
jgi:hypothetical protein